MKIKTHLFDIEIKEKGYFEKGIDEKETIKVGSEIIKKLLDRLPINLIKIEYSKEEQNAIS